LDCVRDVRGNIVAVDFGIRLVRRFPGVVTKGEMSKLPPDDSPKTLAIASGLGAASSSCSYAAVALARSIFRRSANFTAPMAFELASTNLVAELSIILMVLMGWQFALAEFAGGPLMVAIVAVLFRLFFRQTEEAERYPAAIGGPREAERPLRWQMKEISDRFVESEKQKNRCDRGGYTGNPTYKFSESDYGAADRRPASSLRIGTKKRDDVKCITNQPIN
jgi:hypothetical protein